MEEVELPLCVCGCGERVTKVGNTWLVGHRSKSEESRCRLSESNRARKGWKHTEEAKLRMSESRKGKKHSEEHNRNVSKALKGRTITDEWRRNLSEANKGKKHTEEHNRKISEAVSGERNPMWGKKHTEEASRKMSEANRARPPISDETRLKMSRAKSGENSPMWGKRGKASPNYGRKCTEETRHKLSGENAPMWGKHHTEEARRKMSEAHKVENLSEETRCKMSRGARNKPPTSEETKRKMSETRKGENNGRWRGGISLEPYGPAFDKRLKMAIRERDGFTCQLCGVRENGKAHTCHHIDYVKVHNCPENFATLCVSCHCKTGVNRAFWQNLFSARFKLGLIPNIVVTEVKSG